MATFRAPSHVYPNRQTAVGTDALRLKMGNDARDKDYPEKEDE